MKTTNISMLALLLAFSATAAADVAEQLKVCASIADAEARLACFDAIGRARPAPVAAAPEERVDVEEAAPVDQSSKAVVEHEAVKEPEVVPAALASADDFGNDSLERDRKRAKKEASKAAKEARKAEKAKEKREREQVVTAMIVQVWEHQDGRFSVKLDNGQIWRETQGSDVGQPKEGAMAELKRGRFGGYRMNIDDIYRTAWVRRTK